MSSEMSIGAAAWNIACQSRGLVLSVGLAMLAHKKIKAKVYVKDLGSAVTTTAVNGALMLSGWGLTTTAAKIAATVVTSIQYATVPIMRVYEEPPRDPVLFRKCQIALLSGFTVGTLTGIGLSMLVSSPLGLVAEAIAALAVSRYMISDSKKS
jgi:hypothetical protein